MADRTAEVRGSSAPGDRSTQDNPSAHGHHSAHGNHSTRDSHATHGSYSTRDHSTRDGHARDSHSAREGHPTRPDTAGADRTAIDQTAAVLRSIRSIADNVGAGHSLRALAREARFSPFHFHRVFRELTSATPAQFLAAARMLEAKRLLANTSLSVTEICMRVGYTSLGTFTTQFTRLVGVSPRRFRKVFAKFADQSFAALVEEIRPVVAVPAHVQVTGVVTGGSPAAPVVTGLFRSGVPQERPAACAIMAAPGVAEFGGLDDGDYHPLAMSFHPLATVAEALLADRPDRCYVGASRTPVVVRDGENADTEPFHLALGARRATDPPLVLALPLLIAAELRATDRG
ncbi:helix-turn-helix transcriptional regulator [Saccharothrix stipae]